MPRRKKEASEEAETQVHDNTLVEKSSLSSVLEPDYGFDILDDEDDVSESIERVLTSIVGARKNQTVQFNRLSDIREKMVPLKHFYLQWALGIYGIPEACMMEIIGAEGCGKTTFAFQLIGWAMDVGCPAFYMECENKQLSSRRILRALHTDKARALKMLQRLRRSKIHSLDHFEQELYDYVAAARGSRTLKGAKHVPLRVPLIVVVDPWSRLMNLDEAAGAVEYGDNMSDSKKAKFKKAGTASNMGHAKWAQAFCRRAPDFLSKNNVILILVQHQNDYVDMSSGGGGITLGKEVMDLYNKTKIGGRAFNQLAAIQLILSKGGMIKGKDNVPKGRKINMRVDKNSFGPGDRKLSFEIRQDQFMDTKHTLEPALNFDEDWANWMAKNQYFGTKVAAKRYTCEALNIEGVTYDKFAAAFKADQELKQALGERLGIEGYIDTVDRIISELSNAEDADSSENQQTADDAVSGESTPS